MVSPNPFLFPTGYKKALGPRSPHPGTRIPKLKLRAHPPPRTPGGVNVPISELGARDARPELRAAPGGPWGGPVRRRGRVSRS